MVLVCSEHSLQSPKVIREMNRVLEREDRERRNILVPVRIDDYIFDKWDDPLKADVVKRWIGDFREWEIVENYNAALKKLLTVLKKDV